jgi:hypothetical protein
LNPFGDSHANIFAMKKIFPRILFGLLVVGVLLAAWIAFDIYAPHKVDIRDFDPLHTAVNQK